MFQRIRIVPALALVLAAISCAAGTGSVSVNDTVPGTVLSLSTVYGWIDAVTETGNGTWGPITPHQLQIVATGASFDATSDIRFASADSVVQANLDQLKGGMINMLVADVGDITMGAPYTFENEGDSCGVVFGVPPLTNTSATPNPVQVGSNVQCTLTLTQLSLAQGGTFSGTLAVTFTRSSSDPAGAVDGMVTVTLSGPLVNQLLGCNNSMVVADGTTDGESCGGEGISTVGSSPPTQGGAFDAGGF